MSESISGTTTVPVHTAARARPLYGRRLDLSWRCLYIWRRHALVWKKTAITSMLSTMAEPLIYLFGLGYGLGTLLPRDLPQLGGSYMFFLATGTVCASTMNAASFEAMYSAFSRMHVQKTWEAIMYAPVSLDDVVMSELLWAATKAMMSGLSVMLVMACLGMIHSPMVILAVPLIFLVGLVFAAFGLIMTAFAKDYGFFMYYFTLVLTPMTMLCGVFFPLEQLPPLVQTLARWLPLADTVALIRPLFWGEWPRECLLPLIRLTLMGVVAFYIALTLSRRRLLG